MTKGLIYKEWLKTKWAIVALTLLALFATGYGILVVQRVITLQGVAHLWYILLSRDVLFIDVLKYQPLITGVVLALAQFVPEVSQKRLKLTLHLPISIRRSSYTMLLYGVGYILLLSAMQLLALFLYLSYHLAPELVAHLLVSAVPWFLAGFVAYGMTALIVLETTWRLRAVHILVTAFTLHLFFMVEIPRAYQSVLLPLALLAFLACFFALLSVRRFKKGVQ